MTAAAATTHVLELARETRRERFRLLSLSYPTVILVCIVLVLPTLWLFWLSVVGVHGLTLVNFERMVANRSYLEVFRLTFSMSLLVTVICVLLAYPLSYFICLLPRFPASLCLSVVLLPFWTSVLVRTYAWIVLLQSKGVINQALINLGLIREPLSLLYNVTGTAIGMAHIVLPFLILPLYASMKSIDPNFVRAATSLGATPTRAFWTVFLPMTLPGLFAGTMLIFIYCLGFYITPQLLGGGRVTLVSMVIQQNAALYMSWGAASAPGVVLLIITLIIFVMINRVFTLRDWIRD
jgi:putative spermidine/putrescine transport system permease protein/spermidine/putrescine transport system permease protein